MACNGAGGKGAEVEVGETSPVGGEPGLFCDDPDCCRFIGLALMRAKIGLPYDGNKRTRGQVQIQLRAECPLKMHPLQFPHLERFHLLSEILVRLLSILGAVESDIPRVVYRRLAGHYLGAIGTVKQFLKTRIIIIILKIISRHN